MQSDMIKNELRVEIQINLEEMQQESDNCF